jgi:hypothetical protein
LVAQKLKSSVLVLPSHQHALKMGTELGPETPENLHILTRLSTRENLIEFHRSESFKTYNIKGSYQLP